MRTIERGKFPYDLKSICFLFISSDGEPKQIDTDISKEEAYIRTKMGKGRIIAVYPGNYRSDAFYIDADEFGEVFGFAEDNLITVVGIRRGDSMFDTRVSQCWEIEIITKNNQNPVSIPKFTTRLENELRKKYAGCNVVKSRYSSGDLTNDNHYIVIVNASGL